MDWYNVDDDADLLLVQGHAPPESVVIAAILVVAEILSAGCSAASLYLCFRSPSLRRMHLVQMVIFPQLYELVKNTIKLTCFAQILIDRGFTTLGFLGCQVMGYAIFIGYSLNAFGMLILVVERWNIVHGNVIGRYGIILWNLAGVVGFSIIAVLYTLFGTGYHISSCKAYCMPRFYSQQIVDAGIIRFMLAALFAGSIVVQVVQNMLFAIHVKSRKDVLRAQHLFTLTQGTASSSVDQGLLLFRFHSLTAIMTLAWVPATVRMAYEAISGQPANPVLDVASAMSMTIGYLVSNLVMAFFTPPLRAEMAAVLSSRVLGSTAAMDSSSQGASSRRHDSQKTGKPSAPGPGLKILSKPGESGLMPPAEH